MDINAEALKNLKLTGDEFQKLIQKRDDAGVGLAGFPNSEEIQRVLDLRAIASSKAEKQRNGGAGGGFDLDKITLGMSKEDRARAAQEIVKAWSS